MRAARPFLARYTVARCDRCRRTYVIAPNSGPHRCAHAPVGVHGRQRAAKAAP